LVEADGRVAKEAAVDRAKALAPIFEELVGDARIQSPTAIDLALVFGATCEGGPIGRK